MTKFLEKIDFRLSFPKILLLIAVSLYGFLLVVTRLPQNEPEHLSSYCSPYESTNIAGIKIDCSLTINQTMVLIILGLIACGPSLIVSKIFSNGTIPQKWMIVSVIFSFLVYFLVDYLIKIISKVITQKHFKKNNPKRGY